MAQNKPFVRIQSQININVTAGLHNHDVTNPNAHIADRLKINPLWPKMTCLIRQGVGIYPSEIAEWNTVKALAKDNILTIGEFLDSADETVVKQKAQLEEAKKQVKKASLADIAGD